MTENETIMVLTLAKELGIAAPELVDKLKGLNIPVKSHMSEISMANADLARTSLKKAAEPAKPAKKTSTRSATQKAATKTTTAKAAAAPVAAEKAAGTAPSRTRKKAAESPTPAAEAASAAPRAASPIIRRRVKADGETETLTPAALLRPSEAEAQEAEHAIAEQDYAEHAGMTAHETHEAAAATEYAEQPVETVHEEPVQAAQTPAAQAAEPSATVPRAAGSAASTPSPVIQRPVAPRRSILKIVEAQAPPPRPMIRPANAASKTPITPAAKIGDKDGFRIIKMTKENLDQMAEEEAAKKRGGREAEIRPEDVRFADYRKKEMVFLPKKKKIPLGKEVRKTQITEMSAQKRVVEMQETLTVGDLANQLSVKATDVIRKLMQMGTMVNMNSSLDYDTANIVAAEYKYEVRNKAFKESTLIEEAKDEDKDLQPRPPIVTIMGHVDHGKTTLLDTIREANVAAGEAGGITQHIGAYTVYPKSSGDKDKSGKAITFIDTPGHEAFSVMRARGANVTDIVILVVSADDGVMPQTREALSHAKAAGVPIIVAVNKIDKPGANPEKIKQGLAELDLLAEDWGGQTMFVPVSALKKTNIDKLLESILLQAEVLDLKANPDARADGTVLEARLEKGRGPVVSVLVSRGTLRVGDAIVAGSHAGRVKAMMDDKGRLVKEAGPAFAVEVLGFEGVPNAGDNFNSPATEADARKIAENRIDKLRQKAAAEKKVSLEELFAKAQAGETKELNVIVKADVFGSVEAIRDSLVKLSTEKVKVKVILAAAGGVTESDVLLATASNALIIGFGVRPETKARQVAEAEHVEIRSYQIIYELLDDVKKAMEGLLEKKKVERFLGRAEVRQTFSVPKIGTIAGSAVIDGKIIRGANVRLLRDSRVIYEGKMSSLKRFKDDAKEVATGFECGIGIENYNDLKPGDVIEAFQIDLIAGTLDG